MNKTQIDYASFEEKLNQTLANLQKNRSHLINYSPEDRDWLAEELVSLKKKAKQIKRKL